MRSALIPLLLLLALARPSRLSPARRSSPRRAIGRRSSSRRAARPSPRPLEPAARRQPAARAGFGFAERGARNGEFHVRLSRVPRPGSSVMLTIGEQPFLLLSRGDWAWSRGPLQEAAIIAAARGATAMRVEARDGGRPPLRRPLSARRRADRDRCRRRLRRARCAGKIWRAIALDRRARHERRHRLDADCRRDRSRARQARAPRRAPTAGSSWSAWRKDAIRAALEAAGLEPKQAKLRAKQIWHWIYNRGVSDFAAMTDIAKAQAPWLAERFVISRPEVVEAQVSTDGTRKWLLRTHDGHDYEMVFIPDADRGTLCVSSQVGCTLNCTLLPHRDDAAGPQPRAVGDRRPGDAGPRRAGRMAVPARRADADQHRHDGHGRAALQFRQCPRRAEDRHGRRRARPVASAGSPCRPRAWCR